LSRFSTSRRDQRAFGLGANDAIDGESFTLLEAANGAPRRRIHDSVHWKPQPEHIV
jgi:hypothetical protein